jgi:ParB/RepB/Spo0J family partition protein
MTTTLEAPPQTDESTSTRVEAVTPDAKTPAVYQTVAIPVGWVLQSDINPRKHFDEAEIRGLADDIAQHGLNHAVVLRDDLQSLSCGTGPTNPSLPHLVRAMEEQVANGEFPAPLLPIVMGERRWRAVKLLGWTHIPATVREGLTDETHLEMALSENIKREDLTPIEMGGAFARMMRNGKTQGQIGAKYGLGNTAVSNAVNLLDLPPVVQGMIDDGKLTQGHGVALGKYKGLPALCSRIAEAAIEEGASIRDLPGIADSLMTHAERETLFPAPAVLPLDPAGDSPAGSAAPHPTGVTGQAPVAAPEPDAGDDWERGYTHATLPLGEQDLPATDDEAPEEDDALPDFGGPAVPAADLAGDDQGEPDDAPAPPGAQALAPAAVVDAPRVAADADAQKDVPPAPKAVTPAPDRAGPQPAKAAPEAAKAAPKSAAPAAPEPSMPPAPPGCQWVVVNTDVYQSMRRAGMLPLARGLASFQELQNWQIPEEAREALSRLGSLSAASEKVLTHTEETTLRGLYPEIETASSATAPQLLSAMIVTRHGNFSQAVARRYESIAEEEQVARIDAIAPAEEETE